MISVTAGEAIRPGDLVALDANGRVVRAAPGSAPIGVAAGAYSEGDEVIVIRTGAASVRVSGPWADAIGRREWRRRIIAGINGGRHRARDCAACGVAAYLVLCPACGTFVDSRDEEPLIAQPGAVYRWRERIRARSLAAVTLPLDAPPGGLCASWEQSIRWHRSTRCDDRVMRCPSRRRGVLPVCGPRRDLWAR